MPKNNHQGKAEIFQPDQWKAVQDELSPKMRSLFSICYYTGCRISEARQLRAEDIVGQSIVFPKRITKTKQSRSVPMHADLVAVLSEGELPKEGLLFPSPVNAEKPISRQAADKAFRKVCDRLGLQGFSTHSCRRSMATDLKNRGVALPVIQEIGGWASLAALQRYLDVTEEEKVRAIAQR